MDGLEAGYNFCSNPHCPHGLHVRAGDQGVIGEGNWVELVNGAIIGRGIYQGVYLCDPCGRTLLHGAVQWEIEPPPKEEAAELGEQALLDLALT